MRWLLEREVLGFNLALFWDRSQMCLDSFLGSVSHGEILQWFWRCQFCLLVISWFRRLCPLLKVIPKSHGHESDPVFRLLRKPKLRCRLGERLGGQMLPSSVLAPEQSCPLFPEFSQLTFHPVIFGNTERKGQVWRVLMLCIVLCTAIILSKVIVNYDSLALVDYCTNEGPQSLNLTSFTVKFTPENFR